MTSGPLLGPEVLDIAISNWNANRAGTDVLKNVTMMQTTNPLQNMTVPKIFR
jgi:hypothetical protein